MFSVADVQSRAFNDDGLATVSFGDTTYAFDIALDATTSLSPVIPTINSRSRATQVTGRSNGLNALRLPVETSKVARRISVSSPMARSW